MYDKTFTWQQVWREGIAPQLDRDQLLALAEALRTNDERLLQGSTTQPPPLRAVQDWPCEGGCVIAFAHVETCGGWGAAKVGDIEERFAAVCCECGVRMGMPAAERFLLNWWDDTPRAQAVPALLAEVELSLASTIEVAA